MFAVQGAWPSTPRRSCPFSVCGAAQLAHTLRCGAALAANTHRGILRVWAPPEPATPARPKLNQARQLLQTNCFPTQQQTRWNSEDQFQRGATRRLHQAVCLVLLGLPMIAPGLKAEMHSAVLRRVGRRRAAERRFLRPLIEPDVRISRIRLSDHLHPAACAAILPNGSLSPPSCRADIEYEERKTAIVS